MRDGGNGQADALKCLFPAEDLPRRSFHDRLPVMHHHDAVGGFGHVIHAVRDQNDPHAFIPEPHERFHQAVPARRVKSGRGLIQHQDLRLHGQHPGQRRSSLLAAGKVKGRLHNALSKGRFTDQHRIRVITQHTCKQLCGARAVPVDQNHHRDLKLLCIRGQDRCCIAVLIISKGEIALRQQGIDHLLQRRQHTAAVVAHIEDESDGALSEQIVADLDIDVSAGVPNIEGIKRVDDYTVQVLVNGFSAPAVYSILGLSIAPMHYYGDPEQYDYENNQFGHPFGDLSIIQSKNAEPMGAGPYRFLKYENRVVYYEANEYYYLGEPEIKTFQYKETQAAEVATAVQTGTADGGEMTGSKANFEMLRSFNDNGELTGNIVTTYSVANLGYGYIGMNADTMNVAGEPGSDASKNLRKAFATILAVYRDTAIDSYYGDAAAVINYPISTTSWAAPQATDEGYKVAFSVDVDGNDIYTADMDQEAKYAAALEAAIGYLKAAGYTFDEESGKFTEAPEGASLSYEAIIPGDGTGDHPAFAILTDAKAALDTIGIELKINDPADSNVLWDALDAGTQNLWCAAWGATIDPDMYQVYHSSGIVGRGGSDSNHYHIQSDELDQLIVDARQSDDQDYRKQVYKAALDEIIDWAVEVPTYQRQNIVIASSERVDIPTVTGDVTTFWGWLAKNDIQNMKMVEAAE